MLMFNVGAGNHLPFSLTCGTTLYPSIRLSHFACVCERSCACSPMEVTEMLMGL